MDLSELVPRKGLSEARVVREQLLANGLSDSSMLGQAKDNGDCFFDSLAQILNVLQQTNKHSVKSLRLCCHAYYDAHKDEVNAWNQRDHQSVDQGDDYYCIQYTADELEGDIGATLNHRSPIWGRPFVEGVILCRQLDLNMIHVVEVLNDPESDQLICTFHLITQEGYQAISDAQAMPLLKDATVPTLIVTQGGLHFVPLLTGWQMSAPSPASERDVAGLDWGEMAIASASSDDSDSDDEPGLESAHSVKVRSDQGVFSSQVQSWVYTHLGNVWLDAEAVSELPLPPANPIAKALNIYQDASHSAIEFNGETLTYQQLHRHVNVMAQYLHGLKWVGSRCIALYMAPSIDYVIMMLAALKAGVTFLPLNYKLKHNDLLECLMRTKVTRIFSDGTYKSEAEALSMAMEESIPSSVGASSSPSDWAWIIYTSGSTGKPKAVHVHHDGVWPRIESMVEAMEIGPRDCYAQICSLAFDASIQEILVALTGGAQLKIIPASMRHPKHPDLIVALGDVTAATLVKAYIKQFDFNCFDQLRVVIGTGSSLEEWMIAGILQSGTRFINGYGATEETIGSHLGELTLDPDGSVVNHLGRPMKGVQAMFRQLSGEEGVDQDEDGAEEDPNKVDESLLSFEEAQCIVRENTNVVFEMVTTLSGHANEYIDPPRPSYQKAFGKALVDGKVRHVYYSSDVVRIDEVGRVLYAWRLGLCVKRNDMLVDVARLNQVLESVAFECGMEEVYATVVHDDSSPGNNTSDLVVCYRPRDLTVGVNFNYLTRSVLSQCILESTPSHGLVCDTPFPRHKDKETVLHKALMSGINMDAREMIRGQQLEDLNAVENEIASVWRQVLGIEDGYVFRPDDNFLYMGADSISINTMCRKLIGLFGDQLAPGKELELGISDIMEDATLASLARKVMQQLAEDRYEGKPIRLKRVWGDPKTAKHAVVLVHSLFGNATEYPGDFTKIYQHPSTVIYQISAPPFTDCTFGMPSTFEELAALYLSAVESQCGDCNYIRLIGWSAGGITVNHMLYLLQSKPNRLAAKVEGVMLDSFAAETWQVMPQAAFYQFILGLPHGLKLDYRDQIKSSFEKRCPIPASKMQMIHLMAEIMETMRSAKGSPSEKNRRHAMVVKCTLTAVLSYETKSAKGVTLYKAQSRKKRWINVKDVNLPNADALFWPAHGGIVVKKAGRGSTHDRIVLAKELQDQERAASLRAVLQSMHEQAFQALKDEYERDTLDPVASLVLDQRADLEDIFVDPTLVVSSLSEEVESGLDGDDDDGEHNDPTSILKLGARIQAKQLLLPYERGALVVAGPDIGKTTLVRHLAYQWAHQEDFVSGIDALVLVELKKIFEYVEDCDDGDLTNFLVFACVQDASAKAAFRLLMNAYFAKDSKLRGSLRVCFLLDGLNEVRACLHRRKSKEARLLNRLLEISDSVVTTQAQSLSDPLLDLRARSIFYLEGLNDALQIRRCLDLAFRVRGSGTDGLKEELYTSLMSDDHFHQRTLKQPTMLFLFCLLAEDMPRIGRHFQSIGSFYDKLIFQLGKRFLIRVFDFDSSITEYQVKTLMEPLREILSEMAFQLCIRDFSAQSTVCVKEKFCDILDFEMRYDQFKRFKDLIQRAGKSFDFEIGEASKNFEILCRTGVIRQDGGVVVFLLESIRDYLAAEYLSNVWVTRKSPRDQKKAIAYHNKDVASVLRAVFDKEQHRAMAMFLVEHLRSYDVRLEKEYEENQNSDSEADQDENPDSPDPYVMKFFHFVNDRLREKNLLDPMQWLHDELAQLPNGIWLAATIIELGRGGSTVEFFCGQDSRFLSELRKAVEIVFFECHNYDVGFSKNLAKLLFKYPALKHALLAKGNFGEGGAFAETVDMIQCSHLECPELLAAAAMKDTPYGQNRMMANIRHLSVRLLFDARLPRGHANLLRQYMRGENDGPSRPVLVLFAIAYKAHDLADLFAKDELFHRDFCDFFGEICRRMMDACQKFDRAIGVLGDKHAKLEGELKEMQDQLMSYAWQACKAMHALVSTNLCSDVVKQLMFDCVASVFLPFDVGEGLYRRKNAIKRFRAMVLAVRILLLCGDFQATDPRIYSVFLAMVDTYKVHQPRVHDHHYHDMLQELTRQFWQDHKQCIRQRLYVPGHYEESELQYGMWGVTKFMLNNGSRQDCEELLSYMLRDDMMHQGVFLGPVYLLSKRLSKPSQARLQNRLAKIVPDRFSPELTESAARQYAHALIGLAHLGVRHGQRVEQVYTLFKNKQRFNRGFIDERIAYEVAYLILVGELRVGSRHRENWFLSTCYRLGYADNHISYFKDRLHISLIDLAMKVMPDKDELAFKLLTIISGFIHRDASRIVRAAAIQAFGKILDRPYFSNCLSSNEPCIFEGDGCVNLSVLLDCTMALRDVNPEAFLLFETPCVVKRLLTIQSEEGDQNALTAYIRDMLRYMPAMPGNARVHVMSVIRYLLSTDIEGVAACYDRDEFARVLEIRLYDGNAAVRLAAVSMLQAYYKRSFEDAVLAKAIKKDPANREKAFDELSLAGFPSELLKALREHLGVPMSADKPAPLSRLGMYGGYRPEYGDNFYMPLLDL